MTESATYSQVITTEIIGHNAVSAVKWENNFKIKQIHFIYKYSNFDDICLYSYSTVQKSKPVMSIYFVTSSQIFLCVSLTLLQAFQRGIKICI